MSLLGVCLPVFPSREQIALDSLFVQATKPLTQVGVSLSYRLFTDLSISLDWQFTPRNFKVVLFTHLSLCNSGVIVFW